MEQKLALQKKKKSQDYTTLLRHKLAHAKYNCWSGWQHLYQPAPQELDAMDGLSLSVVRQS
jgi:hypothetical protein